MSQRGSSSAGRVYPAWSLALAGALAAAAWLEGSSAAPDPGGSEAPSARRLLEQGSARELRALPGLGERRALELVDARWRHAPGDPPLHLHDLAGIGPAIEAAVRAALTAFPAPGADSP